MRTINWKDIAELIGIAAIVASLIFVGIQLRQDFGIARSQVWTERNMLRAELAAVISEHPEVWIKGVQGEDLTTAERAQFESIFVLFLFKESTHFLQRNAGISPGPPEEIASRFVNMIATYPGLRSVLERWIASRPGGLPPFIHEVQKQLEGLEAGRLEPISVEMVVPY